MIHFKEIKELKKQAEKYQLENREIIKKYDIEQLGKIYNGIGPESFPDWLRNVVTNLHPSLAVVAFIHDVEWHESDGSKENFSKSNERFKTNGYKVAKTKYAWYNPRRYIVMNQARRCGNACQIFGWDGWLSNKKITKKKGKKNMKNLLVICAAMAGFFATGCSHNISTYSDGVGFETTFRPDSGNFGVILRYGKIWNLVARENVEAEMSGNNEFDAEGNPISSKTNGNVKIKIGTQTTGYEKDIIELLKDNPKAIKAFYESKNKINEKQK